MSYESWRISYQSSEQAARAAYAKVEELAARLAELEGQEPVAWYADYEGWGREYNGLPELSNGVIGKPLYTRPAPAEPVNARLLDALKLAECVYRKNVVNEGEPSSVLEAMQAAITAAEAQQERLLQDMHDAGREIDRVMAESAPKAVRLTQEEIKTVLKVNTLSSLVMRICRSIETAVLERNGLKPQAKGQGDHAASRGPWV